MTLPAITRAVEGFMAAWMVFFHVSSVVDFIFLGRFRFEMKIDPHNTKTRRFFKLSLPEINDLGLT